MPSSSEPATRRLVAAQLAIFLIAAAIVLPLVTPGQAVAGGLSVKLAFLGRVTALVAIAHWLLRRRSLRWSDVGLRRPNRRRFVIALAAGLLIVVIFAQIAQAVTARFGLPAPNYSMFAPIKGSLEDYLFWVLPVTVGSAAFGEELMFRGFLTDALQRLCSSASGVLVYVTAVTVQAVIFGGLHFYQGIGGMIVAGATGLALGLTWLIAGRNLWAGIVLHALLDGSAMTAIYLGYVTI